jgi:hypothetical protein
MSDTISYNEYIEIAEKTVNKYFNCILEHSIIEGFLMLELLEDIPIVRGSKIFTAHKGFYFQNRDELLKEKQYKIQQDKSNNHVGIKKYLSKLYYLDIPIKELENLLNNEDINEINEGVSIFTGNTKIKVNLKPIELLKGDYLSFDELLIWCMLKTYKGKSKGRLIYNFAFNQQSNSPVQQNSEILETVITKAQVQEIQASYLEDNKVLKGFEIIAETGKGEYTLETKEGLKYILTANPAICSKFNTFDTSNFEYIETLRSIVCQLLRDPQTEQAVDENNVAWIPSSKILQEMTRTQQGINTRITDNQKERNKINTALQLWQSTSLNVKDRDGKLLFNNVVLQVEGFRKIIKDKRGNEIKDAWGFAYGTQNNYFNQRLYEATRHRQLSAGKPAKSNEIWIKQYMEGELLSQLYNSLYPPKGKGKRQYTVKRNWSNIYEKAVKEAEPTDKVKRRVRKQIAEYLSQILKEYRNDENRIYIKAVTENDKLLITGYKKPYGSPVVEL